MAIFNSYAKLPEGRYPIDPKKCAPSAWQVGRCGPECRCTHQWSSCGHGWPPKNAPWQLEKPMKIPSDQRTKQLMLRHVKLLELLEGMCCIYNIYIYVHIDVIYWRVYCWRVYTVNYWIVYYWRVYYWRVYIYIYEYDWGFEQAWRCFD